MEDHEGGCEEPRAPGRAGPASRAVGGDDMKKTGVRTILSILILPFALTFCVSNGIRKIPMDPSFQIPPRYLIPVPHISQNDTYSCGTTSIAMAISYYEGMIDNPLSKDLAWEISGSDIDFAHTWGHDIRGFQKLTLHYGYASEFANLLSLADLKYLISHGIPVVLIIHPILGRIQTHAVLACGYNDDQGLLYVEDPADGRKGFYYSELYDYWSANIGNPLFISVRAGFIIYPKEVKTLQ
jgi:hypothetical protein